MESGAAALALRAPCPRPSVAGKVKAVSLANELANPLCWGAGDIAGVSADCGRNESRGDVVRETAWIASVISESCHSVRAWPSSCERVQVACADIHNFVEGMLTSGHICWSSNSPWLYEPLMTNIPVFVSREITPSYCTELRYRPRCCLVSSTLFPRNVPDISNPISKSRLAFQEALLIVWRWQ